MSSPFSTFEEFSSAEGPIYTFANNAAMITFLLIICLAISIYFFYASFNLKQEASESTGAKAIGLLLVAGFATILGTVSNPQSEKVNAFHQRSPRHEQAPRSVWKPLALLGLAGIGGTTLKREKRQVSRKYRRVKRSRF